MADGPAGGLDSGCEPSKYWLWLLAGHGLTRVSSKWEEPVEGREGERKRRRKQASGCISNAADPRHAVKERGDVNRMHRPRCCRSAYVRESGLCSVCITLRDQSNVEVPLPKSLASSLRGNQAAFNAGYGSSNSALQWVRNNIYSQRWVTLRLERLSQHSSSTTTVAGERLDDQLIIGILVLICF